MEKQPNVTHVIRRHSGLILRYHISYLFLLLPLHFFPPPFLFAATVDWNELTGNNSHDFFSSPHHSLSDAEMRTLLDGGRVINSSLASPHSHAYIDMNGDCLPDLLVTTIHCEDKRAARTSKIQKVTCVKGLEVYLNNKDGHRERGEERFVLHSRHFTPPVFHSRKVWEYSRLFWGGESALGAGQFSFADVDGDGNIDVIFPVCISTSSSIRSLRADCEIENSIRIVYNVQKALCQSTFFGFGEADCRSVSDLCSGDDQMYLGDFNQVTSSANAVIVPRLSFGDFHFLSQAGLPPLSLRLGDYNLDGFPDLLVPLVKGVDVNATVRSFPHSLAEERYLIDRPNDILSSLWGGGSDVLDRLPPGEVVITLWRNVPCTVELCGHEATKRRRRTFAHVIGDELSSLHQIRSPFAAAFFDLDESGRADLIVLSDPHRVTQTPKKPRSSQSLKEAKAEDDFRPATSSAISLLFSNLYNDAFFLKTLGLNGLCSAWCPPPSPQFPSPRPYGVNFPGGFFKFIVTDLAGERRIASGGQLSQSSYLSLQLPYVLFGLGRAGNYIETIYYGISHDSPTHFHSWICIIPNSQLVAIPFPPDDPSSWQLDLYLAPSGIMIAVIVSMVSSLVALGAIIYYLNWKEVMEDEKEKREKAHLFSFDAL